MLWFKFYKFLSHYTTVTMLSPEHALRVPTPSPMHTQSRSSVMCHDRPRPHSSMSSQDHPKAHSTPHRPNTSGPSHAPDPRTPILPSPLPIAGPMGGNTLSPIPFPVTNYMPVPTFINLFGPFGSPVMPWPMHGHTESSLSGQQLDHVKDIAKKR